MEYLAGRFGHPFLTALHLEPENGLDSLAALLNGVSSTAKPLDVDRLAGRRWSRSTRPSTTGSRSSGGDAGRVQHADAARGRSTGTTTRRSQGPAFRRTARTTSGCVTRRTPTSTSVDVDSIEFNGASKLAEAARSSGRWTSPRRRAARPRPCTRARATTSTARSSQKVQVDDGELDGRHGVEHRRGLRLRLRPGLDRRREEVQERPLHRLDRRPARAGLRRHLAAGSSPSSATCTKYAGDERAPRLPVRHRPRRAVLQGFWVDDVTLDGSPISDGTSAPGLEVHHADPPRARRELVRPSGRDRRDGATRSASARSRWTATSTGRSRVRTSTR